MANIDLSIIIVNYNTRNLLDDLLASIIASERAQYRIEIIVVDNGSKDESVEMLREKYPKVKVLKNSENLGYGAANNKGIRNAKGEHLLLLNSDTRVEKKTLATMLKFLKENSRYQVATCRVELANGKLDPACHRGFPTPWAAFTYFCKLENLFPRSKLFGQYHQGWNDLDKLHEVDVISGAFFMLNREVIEKVGLFDEGFFMYGEDIDWCLRLKKAGFRIAFVPSTKIIHMKGSSGRSKKSVEKSDQKDPKALSDKYFWQTMKLFYKKHYDSKYPKPLMWLIFKVIDLKTR